MKSSVLVEICIKQVKPWNVLYWLCSKSTWKQHKQNQANATLLAVTKALEFVLFDAKWPEHKKHINEFFYDKTKWAKHGLEYGLYLHCVFIAGRQGSVKQVREGKQ
jgi:hypothetical protein